MVFFIDGWIAWNKCSFQNASVPNLLTNETWIPIASTISAGRWRCWKTLMSTILSCGIAIIELFSETSSSPEGQLRFPLGCNVTIRTARAFVIGYADGIFRAVVLYGIEAASHTRKRHVDSCATFQDDLQDGESRSKIVAFFSLSRNCSSHEPFCSCSS